MWKAQKQAVSNILVPPPDPDLPSDPNSPTKQSAPIWNPLSMVTSIINNTYDAPSLEEQMAAIVTPQVAKRQGLTNNDFGDAINKFTEKSSLFYSAFSNYFENKAKADNRSLLLQLLDKLEKGVITQQQFEEMKS